MSCDACCSTRLLSVSSKVSDRCYVDSNENEHRGYVPRDIGLDGGDYLAFEYCLNCGKIQGEYPLSQAEIEIKKEIEEN